MRSGIAGRADAGAQARQFNATPTPATALPAIHDRGAPRPARRPGLQLASSISDEDASHDAGRAGAAAPQHELGKWMPRPRLGDAAWRAPLGRWLETGLRRPETRLPWPENGSSITATRRGTCPGTPGNFVGVPETGPAVAGNRVPRWPEIGSRGGRKSGPTPAGYRVINNGNTWGHVPRNARQLRRGPGRGGRRRVPRWPEIGSSIPGIYRAIGFPHFFPRSSNRAQHPNTRGRPMGTMPPGPTPGQAGGTPLKSNKCH